MKGDGDMRWREGVTVKKENGEWILRSQEESMYVDKKDCRIMEIMEQGICENHEMIRCLVEENGTDEVVAGFLLAQFMVDYMDFIGISQENSLIDP